MNDETLALEMVERVGPRGNYLMEKHTVQQMRQLPFSDLILETSKRGRTGAKAEIETAHYPIEGRLLAVIAIATGAVGLITALFVLFVVLLNPTT